MQGAKPIGYAVSSLSKLHCSGRQGRVLHATLFRCWIFPCLFLLPELRHHGAARSAVSFWTLCATKGDITQSPATSPWTPPSTPPSQTCPFFCGERRTFGDSACRQPNGLKLEIVASCVSTARSQESVAVWFAVGAAPFDAGAFPLA